MKHFKIGKFKIFFFLILISGLAGFSFLGTNIISANTAIDNNCGTTSANILDDNLNPEDNSVLVCLGEHFLNDCQETASVINNDAFNIEGGDMNACRIGGAANTVIDINKQIDAMEEKNYSPYSNPGRFAQMVIVMESFKNGFDDMSKQNDNEQEKDNEISFSKLINSSFEDFLNTKKYKKEKVVDCADNGQECRLYLKSQDKKDDFGDPLEIDLTIYRVKAGPGKEYKNDDVGQARWKLSELKSMNSGYREQTDEKMNLKYIDEYYTYESFAEYKQILARKKNWLFKFVYSEQTNNKVIEDILNYLGKKLEELETVKKNDALKDKLLGNIILKVQDKGKAYYVSPKDKTVHFLGRPKDAFQVMRQQGVGITNKKLSLIPPAIKGTVKNDSDGDLLPDALEEALGTDPGKKDTDGDGYNDKQELLGNYNPNGSGMIDIDKQFTEKQKGKILLQIESHGEAWYVNPSDGRRYFLGRPADAFQIMRELGLGISNNDFNKL
jgi:hypothetical protein